MKGEEPPSTTKKITRNQVAWSFDQAAKTVNSKSSETPGNELVVRSSAEKTAEGQQNKLKSDALSKTQIISMGKGRLIRRGKSKNLIQTMKKVISSKTPVRQQEQYFAVFDASRRKHIIQDMQNTKLIDSKLAQRTLKESHKQLREMSLKNFEEPRAGRIDSSDRNAANFNHPSTPSNNNARSFETSAAQN